MIVSGRAAHLGSNLVPLFALAAAVLCAAGGCNLLKELAPLPRPRILAVFLDYTILPAHRALRQKVHAKIAGPLLVLLVAMVVLGLAVLIYGNLIELEGLLAPLDRASPGVDRATAVPGAVAICPPGYSIPFRTWPKPKQRRPRGSKRLHPASSTPRPASSPKP